MAIKASLTFFRSITTFAMALVPLATGPLRIHANASEIR